MPKTAPHGRWATCVQLVYRQWFGSGLRVGKPMALSTKTVHPQKAVGNTPYFSSEIHPIYTSSNAQLLYTISSVNPQLSTLSTWLTTTTTTYIKYRSIGI
jgi:hypothetical protein